MEQQEQETTQPIRRFQIIFFCLGFLLSYVFFYWPFIVFNDASNLAWLIPAMTFVAIPILDAIVGEFRLNWNSDEVAWIKQQTWLRGLPMLAVPMFLVYQWMIWQQYTNATELADKVGWLLTLGIAGGVMAINIGHELIHRKTKSERFAGGLLLVSVFYGSFKVEHVYGHHAWVATPKDMTTAPKGMTIYGFWLRALTKTPIKAWQLSKEQAERQKRKTHELFWLTLASIGFAALYLVIGGVSGLVFWLIQSLIAILLLETVNYIEHYGLQRKLNDKGRYEPVSPKHSWNSSRLITNYLLFNLQRHADHHANASRTYPVLRHFDESPQMPQGYAAMILLSLVPPFWFGVMNHRTVAQ